MNSVGWLGGRFAPFLVGILATSFGIGALITLSAVIYLATGALLLLVARGLTRPPAPGNPVRAPFIAPLR